MPSHSLPSLASTYVDCGHFHLSLDLPVRAPREPFLDGTPVPITLTTHPCTDKADICFALFIYSRYHTHSRLITTSCTPALYPTIYSPFSVPLTCTTFRAQSCAKLNVVIARDSCIRAPVHMLSKRRPLRECRSRLAPKPHPPQGVHDTTAMSLSSFFRSVKPELRQYQ